MTLSPNTNDSWISDSTDQGFMTDVVEASQSQPVLVDFWAPWCGPCRNLTPNLEKQVNAQNGKVKLVKINIDENPQIAGQMGIQSIPAVVAFNQGQPADGFMGNQPEAAISQFIEKILKGGNAVLEEALDAKVDQADEFVRASDMSRAMQLYADVLQQSETHIPAIVGLARCYWASGDADRATAMLEMIPADSQNHPTVKSFRAAMDLSSVSKEATNSDSEAAILLADAAANPTDLSTRFAAAEALITEGNMGKAVEQLLTLMRSDPEWEEGKAKTKLLHLFEALGDKDPMTIQGRRALSSLLFQ